jgi:hypothetical protein
VNETPEKAVALRTPELDLYARLGQWLAASEVEQPNANQIGATAALRMYFARELGLSPLAAAELSVIRGRLIVSAKLLRALASRGGYRVVPVERSPTSCTARLIDRDTGETIGEYTFTIEDATRAGLVRDKSAWKTHPARMLWARASKFVLDDYAAEVTVGLAIEDEVPEITGELVDEVVEDSPEPEPVETAEEVSTAPTPTETAFAPPKGKRGAGPLPD